MKSHWFFAIAACLLLPGMARSAITAVTLDSAGTASSGSFNTGFTFSNNSTIRITELGKWDINGGGLVANAEVAIYNRTSGQLVSTTVLTSAPAEANGVRNSHYSAITPIVLAPGHYAVVAQNGLGDQFAFDNVISTAPDINWHEGIAGPVGALPADISGFTITRPIPSAYFGANFKYEVVEGGSTLIPVASYVYDGTGAGAAPSTSPAFPDSGGTELINGLFPSSTNFSHTEWVGFQDSANVGNTTANHPQITFDLGGSFDLESTTISYLHSTTQAGGTITAPEEVLVSFSDDGTTFSMPISFTTEFDSSAGDDIRSAVLNLLGNSAAFVRLDFRNASQWTFLTEISFTAAPVIVPEPASLAIWSLLSLALLAYRRRRINNSRKSIS